MKYLKLFEYKTLDDILDKISSGGMSSLSDLEKDFLDKYSKNDKSYKDIEKKINNQDIDIDLSNMTEEEIEEGRCEILWEQMYDEDMDNFLRKYNLPFEVREKYWENLPTYIKKYFKDFIKDIGI